MDLTMTPNEWFVSGLLLQTKVSEMKDKCREHEKNEENLPWLKKKKNPFILNNPSC